MPMMVDSHIIQIISHQVPNEGRNVPLVVIHSSSTAFSQGHDQVHNPRILAEALKP